MQDAQGVEKSREGVVPTRLGEEEETPEEYKEGEGRKGKEGVGEKGRNEVG